MPSSLLLSLCTHTQRGHVHGPKCKCRTEHTNLTVETACDHRELLEVGKSAPFRRDSTGELALVGVAGVVAKVEILE